MSAGLQEALRSGGALIVLHDDEALVSGCDGAVLELTGTSTTPR